MIIVSGLHIKFKNTSANFKEILIHICKVLQLIIIKLFKTIKQYLHVLKIHTIVSDFSSVAVMLFNIEYPFTLQYSLSNKSVKKSPSLKIIKYNAY